MMDRTNSKDQPLIESGADDDNAFYLPDFVDDDDDADDSNLIYLLNAVLSGTARLNVLLPTATILAFTIFAPLLSNNGNCSRFDQILMGLFLALSAASCVFFSLTDSFRTANGRLHYGVATTRGIWTFGCRRRVKPCVPSDFKLRWADLFHAWLSLIAFLGFVFSHGDVVQCYRLPVPRKAVNVVPLVIGFVISVLFVVFPTRRRGIGYPFLLQSDIINSRN